MNHETLKDALILATREFWSTYSSPLLLSNLPKALSEKGIVDYKSILTTQSLKAFVHSLDGQGAIQVVVHPQHRAKIGLIPAGENYSFTEEKAAVKMGSSPTGESQAVKLLDILSKLSEKDLDKVIIPTSVLVKLHRTS